LARSRFPKVPALASPPSRNCCPTVFTHRRFGPELVRSRVLGLSTLARLWLAHWQFVRQRRCFGHLATGRKAALNCLAMKDLLAPLAYMLATIATLLDPGAAKAVVAESLLTTQQLLGSAVPFQRAVRAADRCVKNNSPCTDPPRSRQTAVH
jgi:hypothetical protein